MLEESPELIALRNAAGIRPPILPKSSAELWTDLIRNGIPHCSLREDMLALIDAYSAFETGMDSRLSLFAHRTWQRIDDLRSARPFEQGVDPSVAIALFVADAIEQATRGR